MNYNKIIIYVVVSFLINNCSYYSFKGSTPAHIKSISISPIINHSTEGTFSSDIANSFNELLIKENIFEILDLYESDSKLDIIVNSVTDKPNIYTSDGSSYEKVEEWKLMTNITLRWHDLKNDEVLISKDFSEWSTYNAFGIDISLDGIDNDLDGLIDGEDSDEFGAPREGALRIIVEKVSKRIISELTSTW